MFSSFSGNLSGMTGWIQENSKKAADSIQKSVTDISQGVSDMMVETPQDPTGKQIHFLSNLFIWPSFRETGSDRGGIW
jgi:methyl-accepting chemotaxis protein